MHGRHKLFMYNKPCRNVVNMEELYSWVRNITYYLILITVVTNLLPNKKYEKYIKLFAGMVLILLVLKPLTGSLRLEDKITYYFESISFQNEADDLKKEILGMEDFRLGQMIAQYESAVAQDIGQMAKDAGFYPKETRVSIERSQESQSFGSVTQIAMTVSTVPGEENLEPAWDGITLEGVTPVEPVEIGGQVKESLPEADDGNRQEDQAALNNLRRKIEGYYGLEAAYVEIQLEDR